MSVRLFVGNLPYSATEADIRQHFGTIGDPVQIVIPTDRDTGRPRGFAFVDYDDRWGHAHWLYQHNGGVFLPPWGKCEQWMLSVQHTVADVQRFIDNVDTFARALRIGD